MQLRPSGICFLCALLLAACFSCDNKEDSSETSLMENREEIPLSYAQGFSIYKVVSGYLLEIHPENGKEALFLIQDPSKAPGSEEPELTGTIPMGSKKIILTATTQIPHLTYLDAADRLMAFPNLDLISSPAITKRIASRKVIELGTGPSPDLERIIASDPDWVMVSGFGEVLNLADRLHAAKIPVVVNGEFLEAHPLGKAEWIKATGALLGKMEEADSIFSHIESNYLSASKITGSIPVENRPTVLSGTLYKDVWYAPGKDSWVARLIGDAGGNYVFQDLAGMGSLSLNYEYVLEKARAANLWIGAADHASLSQMGEQNPKYKNFQAFQTNEVYTYTLKKGETGGLMYFEEGYLRPDWVLLDMIKIMYPEEAGDHDFHYFQRLDE
ncbi:ABC transporter substrate-binding protein [Cyclobacterium jeungdonense]|uniref:ABC transporter substrate-binding protein n=1 Tax=Cyclobacterium jeungdonense TaxID=708087 RepID=A0ABT8C8E4_9BACT|nr:ABC transporter substrate-binding protein [Cyclobacterium jeungdonense]MDN3688796.1 ABC transporter substrate-binding protein [Cyclobacterium jeungdonense]